MVQDSQCFQCNAVHYKYAYLIYVLAPYQKLSCRQICQLIALAFLFVLQRVSLDGASVELTATSHLHATRGLSFAERPYGFAVC